MKRKSLIRLIFLSFQVLTLFYIGGMSTKEIARFLGTSPNTIIQRLYAARSRLKEEMLAMMKTTFQEQRLPTGFTLCVVEAIKQIRIHTMPRISALPWGLSLAAGVIITVLSLSPNPGIPDPRIMSMAQSPGDAEMVRMGEIPVDVLPSPEETIFPDYPGDRHGENPGRSGAQGQAALSPAAEGQMEYTFVRSLPEELLGIRGGKLSIDKSGNIYVADYVRRIKKFDPEGELLMSFGTFGSGDGQFVNMGGMDVDISGNIYTVDRYENRVQKFDPDGKFLRKWGTKGDADGD